MAGRPELKRHVQQELLNATGTKPKSRRGGKRRGAGRPRAAGRLRSSERHKRRPSFRPNQPLHITVRLHDEVLPLRRRIIYVALRAATVTASQNEHMRIVHMSVQATHIHLIVEASGRRELSDGLKAFEISAAKLINRAVGVRGARRRGKVFVDRYHCEVISSPRQMRNTLAYVFNNWRKHREVITGWRVDPFSTASLFTGWRDGACLDREKFPTDFAYFVVRAPRTWLLTTGWRRHGLLDWREVPSSRYAVTGYAVTSQRGAATR